MKKKTREMMGLTALGMAALLASAVSCKKSDGGEPAPAPAQGVFSAVTEAQACDSKTMIDGARKVFWTEGDVIRVFNNQSFDFHDFTLLTSNEGSGTFAEPAGVPAAFYADDYVAFYPATAGHAAGTYGVTLEDKQDYAKTSFGINANHMAAKSNSTELYFNNLCGTLMLRLANAQGVKVQSIKVVSRLQNDWLCGDGRVTFGGERPELEMTGEGESHNYVTLNCKIPGGDFADGVPLTGDGVDFYIVLPGGSLQGGFDIEVECLKSDGKTKTAFRKGVSGAAGNTISVGVVRAMARLTFEVGFKAQGNPVEFASGNLYCLPKEANEAETDEWGIEEHPWGGGVDYAGSSTSQAWDPKHVSHFYWTYDAAKAAGQAAYIKGTQFFTDSTSYVFKAKDTDGVERQWRTLNNAEWGDIISNRVVNYHPWAKVYMKPKSDAGGVKGVPVDKVQGLLLFPAEWGLPAKGEDNGGFAELTAAAFNMSYWVSENVVKEEWLEDGGVYDGCVFLPCVGYRDNATSGSDGKHIFSIDNYGLYWSSSQTNNKGVFMALTNANSSTGSNGVYMNSNEKSYARCVRPVRVSEN